ncbi:MAG: cytochrome b N-terminal domain-containing protein [Pseudonocardiaceae bacterium]
MASTRGRSAASMAGPVSLGAEYPGTGGISSFFYIMHVFLFPGLLIALIGVHLALVWYQRHTV